MATVVCPTSSPTPGVLDNPRTAQQPPFVTRLGMRRSREAICEHFLANLENYPDVAVGDPEFVQSVRQHFALLPSRYALDVNTDGLDVLNHKRLLEEVRKDPSAVYFQVRAVEVNVPVGHVGSPSGRDLHQAGSRHTVSRGFPRPAFGSSPNLQALAIEAGAEREHVVEADVEAKIFFEITVASADQPKLLCRLTDVLGDVGLDICEAHAFNTSDKYSLDIFVVDGWDTEGKEELEEALRQRFSQMPPPPSQVAGSRAEGVDPLQDPPIPRTAGLKLIAEEMQNPDSPGKDEWEIDISQLEIESKISAGSFGTLYRGIYCGQEVAVKIMKDVQESEQQLQEFLQEVTIMRRVRHKNVVQFIGACTRKPNLCMLFEYMSCGSLYDYLRSEGPPRHALLLKIALDISRGMDYLHQNNIIHRDLKSTNILLDENHTVKIADFGVARIVDQDGVMTAETGTYRWMAPEVIEHRSYGEKVDVFSFAIVLWELLTAKVPYSTLTPLQAAVGVVQKGLRPEIPGECPQQLGQLMESCWSQAPEQRPSFREVTGYLQQMQQALQQEAASPVRPPPRGGFFSKFRSSGGGRQ